MNNDDWNQHLRALEEARRSGRAAGLAVLALVAILVTVAALVVAALWPGTLASTLALIASVAAVALFLYALIRSLS